MQRLTKRSTTRGFFDFAMSWRMHSCRRSMKDRTVLHPLVAEMRALGGAVVRNGEAAQRKIGENGCPLAQVPPAVA